MKTLEAHRRELEGALLVPVSSEKAKKVLDGLGVAYMETPKWSLPLRLHEEGAGESDWGYFAIRDADNANVIVGLRLLYDTEVPRLQLILNAANAELTRQGPAGSPLFHRQGDNE